ncbi:MAG: magnesium transporter CorA family protein, partial [Candidatus Nanopelagicales bacterium]
MATAWILRDDTNEFVEATLEEALVVLCSEADTAWLDLTPAEFEPLVERLELHPQAVEDALKAANGLSESSQRSKLERFPGHLFLYLFRADLDAKSELRLREIPLFVSKRGIVAVDRARPYDMEELLGRWRENPRILQFGVPALLYGALDLVIDSQLETVDQLADAVDGMEDDLFDDSDANSDPREAQLRGFSTRKSLVRLRRVTQPMRELISATMRHDDEDSPHIDPQLLPYYQDLYDHVLRINDTIEGLRDLITTIYETRLTLFDHTLNTVTRQLAAWAAIIAVPTAVTGFYGQNIPYPGFADHSGFWTSTIIWVSVS